jgi:sorbitol/mannitol transport system permease protein
MARCTNLRFSKIAWPVVAWIVGLIFSFLPLYGDDQFQDRRGCGESPCSFTPTLENYANMTDNYDYRRFATNSIIT